jgi:hypothetical protein
MHLPEGLIQAADKLALLFVIAFQYSHFNDATPYATAFCSWLLLGQSQPRNQLAPTKHPFKAAS